MCICVCIRKSDSWSSYCHIRIVAFLQQVKGCHCHRCGVGSKCSSDIIFGLGNSTCHGEAKQEEKLEREREREIYFKELANIILEVSKYKVCNVDLQAGNPGKSCSLSLKTGF